MVPTQLIHAERRGGEGKIRLGCSAVIFDETRSKVLLTRRADNGQWCLPSGGVEPGESVTETVLRELCEETGLRGKVLRLVGIYSDPDWLVIYPDGNKAQIIALNFEVTIIGGELGLSDETTAAGFFSFDEMSQLEMISNHRQRILDTTSGQIAAFVR
ncbi:MAG: NUDIX hydrolase [Anaerolineae bacterium CG_4_9_14_3_um_filter_57_17]|nr:NUDIX domain-containing protein [bacterium]NCT21806.1 NUDIX domain-containing protein [bacterium]OIO83847.1 MAG: NUDIX hydrolase [Anaerolineae bacterium CG2_30_57_67]PJB67336.1 MAG: NUDIX hydrolase [Anaerolineae bacterium CG_4_9_14_3_um_filter_57_17]